MRVSVGKRSRKSAERPYDFLSSGAKSGPGRSSEKGIQRGMSECTARKPREKTHNSIKQLKMEFDLVNDSRLSINQSHISETPRSFDATVRKVWKKLNPDDKKRLNRTAPVYIYRNRDADSLDSLSNSYIQIDEDEPRYLKYWKVNRQFEKRKLDIYVIIQDLRKGSLKSGATALRDLQESIPTFRDLNKIRENMVIRFKLGILELFVVFSQPEDCIVWLRSLQNLMKALENSFSGFNSDYGRSVDVPENEAILQRALKTLGHDTRREDFDDDDFNFSIDDDLHVVEIRDVSKSDIALADFQTFENWLDVEVIYSNDFIKTFSINLNSGDVETEVLESMLEFPELSAAEREMLDLFLKEKITMAHSAREKNLVDNLCLMNYSAPDESPDQKKKKRKKLRLKELKNEGNLSLLEIQAPDYGGNTNEIYSKDLHNLFQAMKLQKLEAEVRIQKLIQEEKRVQAVNKKDMKDKKKQMKMMFAEQIFDDNFNDESKLVEQDVEDERSREKNERTFLGIFKMDKNMREACDCTIF
mmetsp:Transcript_31945/g.36318  ORF Transcript_31945/g.36318 Transcript_31945/m.36318 type:complete len:530 (-) Transcript_31945:443-2032(-)